MMLKDKILEAGREAIETQVGIPAKVEGWIVRGAYQGQRHQIEVSILVKTEDYEAFEVWVAVDLDTEKVVRVSA